MKIRLICIFLFFWFSSFGQNIITIEVNCPNWSSENRVTFRNPLGLTIGTQICNLSAFYNGVGNNSYYNNFNFVTYS